MAEVALGNANRRLLPTAGAGQAVGSRGRRRWSAVGERRFLRFNIARLRGGVCFVTCGDCILLRQAIRERITIGTVREIR